MPEIIDCFQDANGRHLPWSNFFFKPVIWAGQEYTTNEHAYQAAKTLDPTRRLMVQRADSPGGSKRLGNDKVRHVLRPGWDADKYTIMEILVRRKFTLGSDIGQQLLETGDAVFIEGNHWNDTIWGAVRNNRIHPYSKEPYPSWVGADGNLWYGQNFLGQILMSRRRELALEAA